MGTHTLTTSDVRLLTSLPASELRELLTDISQEDERLAAEILAEVQRQTFHTNDKREVGKFFDVSPETIDLWQRKGMPYQAGGHGVRGWYDLSECAKWLAEQRAGVSLDDQAKQGTDIAYREEKRKIAEIQRKQLQGELVNATEYRERVMRAITLIRKGVESFHKGFGNEAVELLTTLVDEVETTLFEEDSS